MPRRDDGTGARVLPRESLGPMTARPAATRTASWLAVGLAPRRLALAWSTASTCMLDRASAGPALERVPPACTDRWSIGSGVERAPLACSDRPSLRSPLDCVLFPHSTAPRLAVPVCCSCWSARGSPLSGAPRASPAERCSPPSAGVPLEQTGLPAARPAVRGTGARERRAGRCLPEVRRACSSGQGGVRLDHHGQNRSAGRCSGGSQAGLPHPGTRRDARAVVFGRFGRSPKNKSNPGFEPRSFPLWSSPLST